ncbi:MAG: hypothetical protein JSV30_01060 [Candidatus Omnitrophota bacterium]|nr:MAG: hypothetical protein JSV30_01060 [Candidatus Omnitrophota bacterium]
MFRIEYPFKKEILACGAQSEAGFCLTKKNLGYVINGLGKWLEDSVLEHYRQQIGRARDELKIKPKVIAHDLHPEYASTKYAQSLSQSSKGLKYFPIQHHHAHIASCIAENRHEGKVIAVVFDGAGYGEDGNIWGGGFFVGDLRAFRRVAYLRDGAAKGAALSAAGLFDAVSILAGLREQVEYEGQGIIDLEKIVNRSTHVASKNYEFTLGSEKGQFSINTEPILQNISEDLKSNISKSIISAAFHNTLVELIVQVCHKISQKEKTKSIILTGTVFQNKVLLNRLKDLLSREGFEVITHRHFSCNDSNISFGQAVLADARCK